MVEKETEGGGEGEVRTRRRGTSLPESKMAQLPYYGGERKDLNKEEKKKMGGGGGGEKRRYLLSREERWQLSDKCTTKKSEGENRKKTACSLDHKY